MSNKRIFVTGGAGFLGSAVMAYLVNNNYQVIAAKRTATNLFRCEAYKNQVKWVDTTDDTFKEQVIAFKPDVILHAAWSGVSSKERADWSVQLKNFELLSDILEISNKVGLKKLLVLGSQAEYGTIHSKVDEEYPVNALDAYSSCKLASQKIIETFCRQNSIDWYWLRVFSVFGPGEAPNWFIPWIINSQLSQTDCDLTLCEQRYDYLYIDDFVTMITKMLNPEIGSSGIYNICSGQSIQLKTIVEHIQKNISSNSKINFGALPYRANQSMQISGDNSKYNATFGAVKHTSLENAIAHTIEYYKREYTGNKIGA